MPLSTEHLESYKRFITLLSGFEPGDQVELIEDAIKQAHDIQLMAEYSGHMQ